MLSLENPFIFAPVKLGYTTGDGKVNQRHINFYNARSKNMGAVTYEPLYLDKGLRELPTQLGIDADDKIEGLKILNETVHKNGAKTIAHLNHPGRMANPKLPGNYYLSSVDKACEKGGATPKAMVRSDMEQVISLFRVAAQRARDAGFDIIELQFGHGYLMAQFISPAVNTRSDKYGGSFENRIKFPLEVLENVQQSTNLPVIVRISGDEMIENGFHLDEMISLSKILKEKGVAAIHVTAGTACSTPPWFFQHMFVPKGKTWEMAARLKKEVDMPVIFVGRINSRKDVDLLLNEYHADYIGLGRALVADPDFAGKYLHRVKGNIRPCLACSEGCLGGVKSGTGLGCVVNPIVGREREKPLRSAKEKKHIAIVGGGLAGMEAAITLKKRGHEITVFEKNKLGGQFNLAWLPPKKESLKEIVDYFKTEIRENGIEVVHHKATPEKLVGKDYDEVIIATGAVPAIPPIKGLKTYYWADLLEEDKLPENQTILVIGGGLIGTEMASKMVDLNNKVIIVEMLGEIARGMEMLEKKLTLQKLTQKNVSVYLNTKVLEIEGSTVTIEKKGEVSHLKGIDKIVMATGMKPVNDLENELAGKIPIHVVGDAKKPGKAQEAIANAYHLALTL
ncbi:MAG: FAD-dependent oxidoreductase [Chlorobi bacterium]|nr:FAD-dependent oxidoreductase [Chlorobiota bacterium]